MPPGATLDFNIKAWKSGGVSRPPSKRHDFGLELEQREDGHYYFTKCEGLVKDFTEFKVGDRLYKFQEKPADEWTLEEIQQTIANSLKLTIEALNPEKMMEQVKVQDLPIEKGDVVPLKDYKEKPELNGHDVEILRKLNSGKYLVTPVGKMKEKLLIDASNLHLEIETDKLTLKDLSDDEETVDEEDEEVDVEGEEDRDSGKDEEEIPNKNNGQEEKKVDDEKESPEKAPQAGTLEEPEGKSPDGSDDDNGNDEKKKNEEAEEEETKTPDVSAGVESQQEEVEEVGDNIENGGGDDDDKHADDAADKEE